MKRILLLLVVVVAGGIFFAHYQVTSDITDGLDKAAMQLSPLGQLTYGKVAVTPAGNIEIASINFSLHTSPDQISVERVVLETGSIWTLLQLSGKLKDDQVPDQMRLRIEGFEFDPRSEFLSAMTNAGNADNPFAQFEAAGCGDRRQFTTTDLSYMGYSTIVWDTNLGYRITDAGTRVTIDGDFETRGQAAVHLEAVFDNDLSVNSVGATKAFAQAARLASAKFRIDDRGYQNRITEFCAKQTRLTPEEFREHHLAAWEALWQEMSVDPGEAVKAAYRDFIEHPGTSLMVEIEPFPRLEFSENYISPDPAYLSQRLNPKVGTSNLPLQPVLMATATPVPKERRRESTATQDRVADEPTKPASTAARTDRISPSQLGSYLNRDVQITLTSGRSLKGRVLKADGRKIQLRQQLYGGNMDTPVELSQIRSARLL